MQTNLFFQEITAGQFIALHHITKFFIEPELADPNFGVLSPPDHPALLEQQYKEPTPTGRFVLTVYTVGSDHPTAVVTYGSRAEAMRALGLGAQSNLVKA
jgi:hypothetical protein